MGCEYMDLTNLERLKERARFYKNYLSEHMVLKKYWPYVSLVMKGSTARGYSDTYSDIDLVIFTNMDTKKKIVADYISLGLSSREDGIFLPLGDWEGHYNIETYNKLETYFTKHDMINIWEYIHVIIMHDENCHYGNIINDGLKELFKEQDRFIMEKYLDMQLYLDWLRQPLRRADKCAAIMYASNVLRAACQLTYLLNTKTYPCDKWLFYYLDELDMPDELKMQIRNYAEAFGSIGELKTGLDLMEYALFAKGIDIVSSISELLKGQYGNAQWIEEWYLFA
jgi:hypothetical protein